MKKGYILLVALVLTLNLLAQTSTDETKSQTNANVAALTTSKELPDGWSLNGTFNFNLNEAGRNAAWGVVKGGEEQTIGIKAIIDYDFDFKNGKTSFLNNFRGRYGLSKTTSAGEAFNKTDDYFNYTHIYATELKKNWNFSALFSVETQFDYYFLSPGSVKLGPGILYKPNANFSAMFSPVMANLVTKLATEQRYQEWFGVDSGKTVKLGLGSFLQLKANYNLAKGITYKGFATLYSNYLNKPQNIIIDWTNLFTLTVNKYIGATISLNIRYNDWEVSQLQVQHGIGVGFSYKLVQQP